MTFQLAQPSPTNLHNLHVHARTDLALGSNLYGQGLLRGVVEAASAGGLVPLVGGGVTELGSQEQEVKGEDGKPGDANGDPTAGVGFSAGGPGQPMSAVALPITEHAPVGGPMAPYDPNRTDMEELFRRNPDYWRSAERDRFRRWEHPDYWRALDGAAPYYEPPSRLFDDPGEAKARQKASDLASELAREYARANPGIEWDEIHRLRRVFMAQAWAILFPYDTEGNKYWQDWAERVLNPLVPGGTGHLGNDLFGPSGVGWDLLPGRGGGKGAPQARRTGPRSAPKVGPNPGLPKPRPRVRMTDDEVSKRMGRVAEGKGWRDELAKGRIGLRGPDYKDLNTPGFDYATFDEDARSVRIVDAKYRKSRKYPGADSIDPETQARWLQELKDYMIKEYQGPEWVKKAVLDAIKAGRVDFRIFGWP